MDYAEQMELRSEEGQIIKEKNYWIQKGLVLQATDMELEKRHSGACQLPGKGPRKKFGSHEDRLWGHTGEEALQYILDNAAVASPEKYRHSSKGSPKGHPGALSLLVVRPPCK